MSRKGGEMFQIESVRLSINEHMASVREEISCVVNERLSSVEQFMFNLFQREMETLVETLLERRDILHRAGETSGSSQRPNPSWEGGGQAAETEALVHLPGQRHWSLGSNQDGDFLHFHVYKEEVPPEQQESSSSLVQEEPEPPHIEEEQEELLQRPEEADGSALTLLAVKSEGETSGSSQRPNPPWEGGCQAAADTEALVHHPGQHHWSLGSNQDGGVRPRLRGRRRLPGGTAGWRPAVTHLQQQALQLHYGDFLHLSVYKEEQQERSSSLVQEEPEPPHIKEEQEELLQRPEEADGSALTSLSVKSEGDDEKIDTEAVASTSTQHMNTQGLVKDCGTSQPTGDDQLLSSHRSDSDITEDSDEWEEETRGVNQSALKSHKTHNVDGERNKLSRNASDCGKVITNNAGLKAHMMTHTSDKPFTCTVCGKGFTHKTSVKSHMRTHTGEKPFTCTVCGKGCTQKGNLKSHMLTHTGAKPFNCTVCGKGCIHRSHLKIHMLTHTRGNPFTCTVCGKGFTQRYTLNAHMLTHTGQPNVSVPLDQRAAVGVAVEVDHHPPGNPGHRY